MNLYKFSEKWIVMAALLAVVWMLFLPAAHAEEGTDSADLSAFSVFSSGGNDQSEDEPQIKNEFSEKAQTDSLAERIKRGAEKMLEAIKKIMPASEYEKAEKIFGDYQQKVDEGLPADVKTNAQQ